jgi:hypothetical protein
MVDRYTIDSSQSWGGRLSGSLKGMISGLFIGIIGVVILFWNEGNSVHQHKALSEGLKTVIDIPSPIVDAANEGKLVHLIGKAETNGTVSDDLFGVTPQTLWN